MYRRCRALASPFVQTAGVGKGVLCGQRVTGAAEINVVAREDLLAV